MKKKWIALLLASAMALGTGIIMTGCNDSNTDDNVEIQRGFVSSKR